MPRQKAVGEVQTLQLAVLPVTVSDGVSPRINERAPAFGKHVMKHRLLQPQRQPVSNPVRRLEA